MKPKAKGKKGKKAKGKAYSSLDDGKSGQDLNKNVADSGGDTEEDEAEREASFLSVRYCQICKFWLVARLAKDNSIRVIFQEYVKLILMMKSALYSAFMQQVQTWLCCQVQQVICIAEIGKAFMRGDQQHAFKLHLVERQINDMIVKLCRTVTGRSIQLKQ